MPRLSTATPVRVPAVLSQCDLLRFHQVRATPLHARTASRYGAPLPNLYCTLTIPTYLAPSLPPTTRTSPSRDFSICVQCMSPSILGCKQRVNVSTVQRAIRAPLFLSVPPFQASSSLRIFCGSIIGVAIHILSISVHVHEEELCSRSVVAVQNMAGPSIFQCCNLRLSCTAL